jgi:uncharacterized protein Yka (UPF0111/DUF47 family)
LASIVRRVRQVFLPGEEEAFTRIGELAALGEEALTLLVKILSAPRNGNGLTEVSFCTEKISALEKDGDLLTQALEEKLGRGSISALLMNEFDRLLDSVDNVLDGAHALSRQLRRVTKHPLREAREVEDGIRKGQVELIQIGLKQLHMLRELLQTAGKDNEKALSLAREIEKLEETGDDIKDQMLDQIYGSWEKLDYASFHNHIETTIEADDILDECEDASDLVVTIMKSLGA